ncbi:sensor domain-containing diguanylate cyclase [Cohnella zeiphila]|uniref:GGDEF domain-containing protein n=1 Tax=Cohnella zeiphila TaxID=2761120 RepID=A0A7X0VUU3_9BACL|nr:sensor domain-containing diguanylate cyclase [Cohnella zeiphila]MBB6731286.1 GGDEF domain-containing protein [Cohnella zeiphila]
MELSRRKGRGVRLSFIIFAVVFISVAATLALSTAVGYRIQSRALTRNTLDLNRITANELSRTTQTIILSMQDTLKSASESISGGPLPEPAVQREIDFLRASVPYFNSVVLVNAGGTVVSTSPEALNIKGQKLTSTQAKQALAGKKPMISAPYKAATGRMIVLASYPVYDENGVYAGFIGGSIYLQEKNVFQNILGKQEDNKNGSYYYVVDASGNLIYHPEAERIGENVSANPAVRSIMNGIGGQMAIRNTEGIRFLAGFSIVPAVGWGIVSQTPASSVDSDVGQTVTRMAAVSAPLAAVLLLLGLLVSRRLAAPINRLAQLAFRLNRGEAAVDMPEAPRYWNYEANELYQAVSGAFRALNQKAEDFSREAHTDQLTGLTNRRMMDLIVGRWIGQRLPFAVIMLDLDRFKSVNDTYGHLKGDEVLRFLARIMTEEKRDEDYCCRYGGEEFAVLLPYASAEQAFEVAERIRARTEGEISPVGKAMTLSLGVSSFPAGAEDAESLFRQADGALYQAKQTGRNRTVLYREAAAGSENGFGD